MIFFTLLAFTTNGTKRMTLCEGRWMDDADGGRTVRIDSTEFPPFWLSGMMTGPGGDDFVVTGGRIDTSWGGDACIPHTQFMTTRLCPEGIEVYCDDGFSVLPSRFSVLIPVRAPTGIANDTPAGQSKPTLAAVNQATVAVSQHQAQVSDRQQRKRSLELELETVRSIEQIAKKQKYGAGAGLSGNSVEARMATERRHHDETKGKLWQNCTRIIAEDLLKNGNTNLYFGEPMRRDYYPGYYEIIKEPRDLGTIKKNLDSRTHYKDIYELRDDVRLCFENCRMFNPQGHQVRNFGDAASNTFEKKWAAKNVEAEWEGELQRHQLAMDRLQAEAKSLPEKEVGEELQALASKVEAMAGQQGAKDLPPGPGREMPQIIKKSTGGRQKKDVQIKDAKGWADLSTAKNNPPQRDEPDVLWEEFKGKEREQQDLKEQRKALEEQEARKKAAAAEDELRRRQEEVRKQQEAAEAEEKKKHEQEVELRKRQSLELDMMNKKAKADAELDLMRQAGHGGGEDHLEDLDIGDAGGESDDEEEAMDI